MGRTSTRLGLLGLCCATACYNPATEPVGSKYAIEQLVTAASGATLTVTPAEDSKLAGVSIVIPPGALAKDTTITIAEGAALSLATGSLSVGPVADFGPAGTTFGKPATIILPFQLPSGVAASTLSAVGVEADGTTRVFAGAELAVNAGATTMSFPISSFTRYGGVSGPPCPAGDTVCTDCNGGGTCQTQGSACLAYTCPADDGGVGGSDGGGGNGCPAGQEPCCCGTCMAAGACTIACPAVCPTDAGTGCPTGETECNGSCVPSGQPCSVCPPTEYDCCGQCLPNTGGIACACPVADAGPACPPGQVACDGSCIPSGVACVACPSGQTNCCGSCAALAPNEGCGCTSSSDAGTGGIADGGTGCVTCPSGEYWCGCGSTSGNCIPDNQACPLACPEATPVCNSCPPGDTLCNGQCIPGTQPCAVSVDAGSSCVACPIGDYWCGCTATSGQCISDQQACPLMCPVGVDTCGPCPSGETFCADCNGGGTCQANGQCPTPACQAGDGGTGTGSACPSGEYLCPDGSCIPMGAMCTTGGGSADAGTISSDGGTTNCTPACQTGYQWCGCSATTGQCIPASQACPLMCPSYPPC